MEKLKKKPVIFAWLMIVALSLGAAWTKKRLTYATGDAERPAVATYGSNIYVVYEDDSSGNDEIYFRKSADSGSTWQSAKKLTDNSGVSCRPRVAVSGANVYVVWDDETPGKGEIYFRRSTDYGATWDTEKRLTNNSEQSWMADIAASGENVYVAWCDANPGNYEIYFRRSTDSGSTWESAQRLTNNAGDSYNPSIAASGSKVAVAWYDFTPGNGEIYFRRSTDNGATWKNQKRLTNNTEASYIARVAISGANAYVVWYDAMPGNCEIYFRKSTDSGSTWASEQKLTDTAGGSYCARIAISGSKIFLAWYDDTTGSDEIYFRKSTDGGATWQSAKRLTDNTIEDMDPDIAVNDANVYVVWKEQIAADGDWEIFIKYSPL